MLVLVWSVFTREYAAMAGRDRTGRDVRGSWALASSGKMGRQRLRRVRMMGWLVGCTTATRLESEDQKG